MKFALHLAGKPHQQVTYASVKDAVIQQVHQNTLPRVQDIVVSKPPTNIGHLAIFVVWPFWSSVHLAILDVWPSFDVGCGMNCLLCGKLPSSPAFRALLHIFPPTGEQMTTRTALEQC